ncbi:GNAT family N-acetyltransferase [Pseudonocardia sp.]|uniref:GNAT family N-acetyltransferase n=1 Tax=Pseudonocardia sp. TaxID=60912 RepID=UPI003D148A50
MSVEQASRTRRTPPVARALLADGSPIRLRELVAADAPLVDRLYADLPLEDRYLRFFSGGSLPRPAIGVPGRAWLGAFRAGALIGVAEYATLPDPGTAEVALVVAHPHQTRGLGTLLLEHLAALARRRGIRRFSARVLRGNTRMRQVLDDSGLTVRTRAEGDELGVEVDLEPDEGFLEAAAAREQVADVASLRPLLRPRSVVVVGASRRPDTVGHAVLRGIVAAGFTGTVGAVNPHAAEVAGVPCHRSVAELPSVPDLAVVCVPAAAVPGVAQECGARGIRALVVISSGLSADPELAGGLLDAVDRHGLRMIGPNCLGIANHDPAVRLDAGFAAPGNAAPGDVGVVSQSGGMTIAVQDELRRLGLGVSTAVSTGDKYDVSANDLLLWWQADERTAAAVLYMESFGNPRKFSRFARRLSARIPVVTLRSGSSEAGRRAAASHTAATATPRTVRDALFRQAGVSAVDRLGEVTELLALLRWQPLPRGRRVAVVSNAGGAGVLAADSLVAAGLTVAPVGDSTRHELGRLLPSGAAVTNPVDTTAVVDPGVFAEATRILLAAPDVDAVVAVTVPTALGDPGDAVVALAADRSATPLLAVRPTQVEHVGAIRDPRTGRTVPSYADAAAAAVALAHAADRAAWLARPAGRTSVEPAPDLAGARGAVTGFLDGQPDGGWLPMEAVQDVLAAFGLPILRATPVAGADAAVAAFEAAGRPVALKVVADGVLHKAVAGGVLLGLDTAEAVAEAAAELTGRFGDRLRGLLVQPMAAPGPELLVGITGDPAFGPLVTVGLGGTLTDLVADRAHRLVPLSTADADELLDGFHAGATLFGAGDRVASRSALRDVILRIGRLAELVPEITELDLNPVIPTAEGCVVVDARIAVRRDT